ncbi:MAG: hypothetical protein ABIJ22_01375 [Patescibacteria group bacterium]
MSSIYWTSLPWWLEDSSKKLKIPPSLIISLIEFMAAQIFGMLLYMVSLNLSVLLSKQVPIIFQVLFNYLFFKIIQFGVSKFKITPLPTFLNKNHERFIKTVLLPSSGIVVVFSGAGVSLAVIDQYSPGILVKWLPFLFSLIANSFYLLFIDQFLRIGKSTKLYKLHFFTSILFTIATIMTIVIFYTLS